MYAAIKDGQGRQGQTAQDLVDQVCKWGLRGKSRTIWVKVPGKVEVEFNGYTDEYTDSEAYAAAVQVIFNKLPLFGFTVYHKKI